MLLGDVEERQLCPEDVGQINLVVDVAVANQRYGNNAQDGYHAVDGSFCTACRQPPRPNAHQQGGRQPIDTHERISQDTGKENNKRRAKSE